MLQLLGVQTSAKPPLLVPGLPENNNAAWPNDHKRLSSTHNTHHTTTPRHSTNTVTSLSPHHPMLQLWGLRTSAKPPLLVPGLPANNNAAWPNDHKPFSSTTPTPPGPSLPLNIVPPRCLVPLGGQRSVTFPRLLPLMRVSLTARMGQSWSPTLCFLSSLLRTSNRNLKLTHNLLPPPSVSSLRGAL